jgi:hypothetical protein
LTLDDDVEQVAGSKYLNTVQDQNFSFSFEQQQAKFNESENKINNRTMNKINEPLQSAQMKLSGL